MAKIEYVLEDLEKVSNMSGDEMIRNDNDIFIRKTAENAAELLKEQQPKWIPVEERLPEEDEDVLVWVNGTYRDMAYRDEGRWYDETHNILQHITHWMPLPEPPKDGEQE